MTQTTSRLQKSLPDREGTGTLPPRRWGNSWGGVRGETTRVTPSGPTTTRTTLTLSPLSSRASINTVCSELFMLRLICAQGYFCHVMQISVGTCIPLNQIADVMRVCSSLFIFPGIFSSSGHCDPLSSCFNLWWKNDNPSRCKSYGVRISHLWG